MKNIKFVHGVKLETLFYIKYILLSNIYVSDVIAERARGLDMVVALVILWCRTISKNFFLRVQI